MAFYAEADFGNGDDSMDWGHDDAPDDVTPAPEPAPQQPSPATPPAAPAIVYTLYQVSGANFIINSLSAISSSAARATRLFDS